MAFRRTSADLVPARPKAIVAAAASIALDGTSWKNWKLGDQRWQEEAWRHYDDRGALRYAADWMGNALSRCRLYLAKLDEDGGPGEEVSDPKLAVVAGTMFGGPTQKAEALRTLGIQLYVAGESYIVAESVANAKKDIWYIVSTSEIRRQAGRVIVDRSNVYGGGKHELDPGKDLLIRAWTPHPRRYDLANSPVRAALPDLRELEQLRKKVFAQIDSRLAGAGLLFLPEELEFPSGDDSAAGAAGLMKIIERAMAAALLDQSNAAALVPIIVQIAGEYIDKIKWQTFETPFQAETLELRQEAIRQLALALDQPAEILLGQGSANHWSAWQIEESTIKLQIEPLVARVADALYSGYGRAALSILGVDPDDYMFWYDPSALVIRPDRQADALALDERLSDEAVRKAGNWSEDDAPSEEELLRKKTWQLVLAQPTLISNKDIQKTLGVDWNIEGAEAGAKPSPPEPAPGVPQPRGLPQPPRSTETPAQEAALIVGADLIVRRALEKAGHRLLTAPRRGQFAGIPAWELHCHIPVSSGDAERLTGESWEPARALANRLGMDPDVMVDMLATYTTSLMCHGEVHDYTRFGTYVSQALDLIGHAECGHYCRNPLHPGPCRGWRRQLDVAPELRRDKDPEPRAARRSRRRTTQPGDEDRGTRRTADTGTDREAESSRGRRRNQEQVTVEEAQRVLDMTETKESKKKLPAGSDPKTDLMKSLRSSGGSAEELDEAQKRVREAMIAAYSINDRESGLRTDITDFGVYDVNGQPVAGIEIEIYNRSGFLVGTSSRTWRLDEAGRLRVTHEYLSLDRSVQGGGFSQRYNAGAEEIYHDAGVAWIDIHADIDVGGYTWASQGYDFRGDNDLRRIAAGFQRHRETLASDDPDAIEIDALLARSTPEAFIAGTHPTPYEFAMLGRSRPRSRVRNGRPVTVWTGKLLLLNTDWYGRKPITEPVRVFDSAGRHRFVAAAGAEDAWDARQDFLDAVADLSLRYADAFGEIVPAYPEDAQPNAEGRTDYAEHHHLISAAPGIAQVWLDEADELFGGMTAAAHLSCQPGEFCRNPLHPGPCKGWKKQIDKAPELRRDMDADEPPERGGGRSGGTSRAGGGRHRTASGGRSTRQARSGQVGTLDALTPGRSWWNRMSGDTGPGDYYVVNNVNIQGHLVRHGFAVRRNGIAYMVETDGPVGPNGPNLRLVDKLERVHQTLPEGSEQYQKAYNALLGRNPEDARWAREYNRRGFTSLATAGDGSTTIWNDYARTEREVALQNHASHEFGHNVAYEAGARWNNPIHDTREWLDAGTKDAQRRAPTNFEPEIIEGMHRLSLTPDHSARYPNGVTTYGVSAASEDFAESLSLYLLEGPVGFSGTGDEPVPVYFRQLFPARAKILDRMFPAVARAQRRRLRQERAAAERDRR